MDTKDKSGRKGDRQASAKMTPPDERDTTVPKRRQPTPGHATVIHDASEISTAQVGAGGLGDLVRPDEIASSEDDRSATAARSRRARHRAGETR